MPLDYDGTLFSLSACVGVAIPAAGTAALDMIGQADNAVYQAKRHGRGRVELFDVTMQQQIDRETELELALREAVRNGELIVHLQPVTDLRDELRHGGGGPRAMDASRSRNGPTGRLHPDRRTLDIILEIERWVLTQACERLVAWKRRDPLTRAGSPSTSRVGISPTATCSPTSTPCSA